MRFKNIFAIALILSTIVLFLYFVSTPFFGPSTFDMIIKNGLIVDGLGGEPYKADIGIYRGRIIKIGALAKKESLKSIDAAGFMVCPGFIDLLNHVDEGILAHPDDYNFIRRGITTVVGSNWGDSSYPIEFLKNVKKTKITLNFCTLVGYNTVRAKVSGSTDRVPGKNDIKAPWASAGDKKETDGREKGFLTFQEAIKKMTWLPAKRLGLKERGCIAEGFYADITIVDPVSAGDLGTWQNPHRHPQGIPYVLVNGKPVVENNEFQGTFPGMVIYGKMGEQE
ncbi:MAG TPA: amidohydrolase family protein [Candidatus Kapabacteria bacterium]|nr:amidohydrolase family protein [Candidatus Kapabacteria bacterium]